MAATNNVPCPKCKKILKVPESAFGKSVKCKYCGEKFVVEKEIVEVTEVVEDEDTPKAKPGAGRVAKPTAGTSKPGAEKSKKEEPKPEAPANTYSFADDDDEGDGGKPPKPLGVVFEGEDIPRCPHCAKELDPPDAVVCIHCGFNNMTREKAETKKTWQPTTEDWIWHLLPGILAVFGFFCCITSDVIVLVNMDTWLEGSFLEKEPRVPASGSDPGTPPKYIARCNDACIMFTFAASVMPIVRLARFAIKRLIINPTPEEKVKT